MQRPVQINFHGLAHSDAVEQRIREKAAELERFSNRITGCHVTVEAQHRHHHTGNLYAVRIDLHMPNKQLVTGHVRPQDQAHEDLFVAIRDAFDAAARQLEDFERIRRGAVKHHEVPDHGWVSRLYPEKGYGFVRRIDGSEVYFHEHSLVDVDFRTLAIGHEVRITVVPGEKGPQASTVVLIGKHHLQEPVRP
jgi:cold shock CspA family protein/ribosome-associated translation inhibitor RaiA